MTVQVTSATPADAPLVVFDRPMAIVGGGAVELGMLRELDRRGVALVGADGGAEAIDAAGLTPELIIGDLDSLGDRAAWEVRTRVIHIPEQVTTDFQKALNATRAPVTLALGMTGKRLDHTLAALSAMLQFAPRRRLLLVDEVDVALAVVGAFRFQAEPGERVSVHPLLPIHFRGSRGLLYPLDGLTLEPGGLLGSSNEGTGGQVEIIPASETPWLLILAGERLFDLMSSEC